MNDYKTRGKNIDAEYMKLLAEQKESGKKETPKPRLQFRLFRLPCQSLL
jgi:hypothetical protein